MSEVPAGAWVEIHAIVLPAGDRAPQVPDDTRRVPLEMRAKGRLVAPGSIGDDVEIETPVGRRLRGRLETVDPAYTHGFGPPVPELAQVGPELRALLEGGPRS